MQKEVSDSREAKKPHRKDMESVVTGNNHNPNELDIVVCSSTQTRSFQPIWPVLIFVIICCAHSSIGGHPSSLLCLTFLLYIYPWAGSA